MNQLTPHFVESENLDCVAHVDGTLYVRFIKTKFAYRYPNFPASLYQDMLAAERIGPFFDQHVIKGRFRYERMKEDPFLPVSPPVRV